MAPMSSRTRQGTALMIIISGTGLAAIAALVAALLTGTASVIWAIRRKP